MVRLSETEVFNGSPNSFVFDGKGNAWVQRSSQIFSLNWSKAKLNAKQSSAALTPSVGYDFMSGFYLQGFLANGLAFGTFQSAATISENLFRNSVLIPFYSAEHHVWRPKHAVFW